MRVTSDLFVSALLRRVFSDGGFAAVMRKGASEAGAVFIVLRARDGRISLLGPAPQSGYDDQRPASRRFVVLAEEMDEEALDKRIEREARFDSDVWFVELDTMKPAADLVDLLAT